MPRIKTSDFENMTLRQIKAYSDIHPAEGKRLASVCGDAKKYCAKNYWNYQKEQVMDLFIPGFSKDNEFISKS